MVREYKGSHSGEHGRLASCASEFHEAMFAPASLPLQDESSVFDPDRVLQSRQDRDRAQDGRPTLCPLPQPDYRGGRFQTRARLFGLARAGGGFQGGGHKKNRTLRYVQLRQGINNGCPAENLGRRDVVSRPLSARPSTKRISRRGPAIRWRLAYSSRRSSCPTRSHPRRDGRER